MHDHPVNEQVLLQRIANGDGQAFAEVYQYYQPHVSAYILRYVKSPDLAGDITQEVFIRLWEGRRAMAGVASFKAYLFVSARNHVLNVLKKAGRIDAAKGEIIRHYTQRSESADEAVNWKEYQHYILGILQTLSPQTRTVFRLLREEHKSYDEVAELLGISRNAVKKHVMRFNKTFRDALGAEGTSIGMIFYLLQAMRHL